MVDPTLLSKVHTLSDLELAFLLSLIAREHCQIRTPSACDIPDLVAELTLLSTNIFALQPVIIPCTPQTTLDDFASALLLPRQTNPSDSPASTRSRSVSPFTTRKDPQSSAGFFLANSPTSPQQQQQQQQPSIAPIILATNLDQAPKAVQIQALELLRTKRIFTRTSVHTAPKTFLFVAVIADDSARPGGELNQWLNDRFHIAHRHQPEEEGYPNLEEAEDGDPSTPIQEKDYKRRGSSDSSSSVLISKPRRRPPPPPPTKPNPNPRISEAEISLLSQLSTTVKTDIDVTRYQMNIVSFLRMHRAVAGGITPSASKHLEQLVKCLAPLHGLDFVTPSLVQLAARKVYLHRIRIVTADKERSMQWGSELGAVEAMLEGVGAEEVLEDVVGLVGVPL